MARTRLQYGTPETDSNLLYATRFPAPDPVLLLERGTHKTLLVRDMEIGRAKEMAKVNAVLGFEELGKELDKIGIHSPMLADYTKQLLSRNKIKHIVVPNSFPAGLMESLRARNVTVAVEDKPFYPARASKLPWEVREIVKAQRATEAALARAFALLRAARIEGKRVKMGSRVVTSELLKQTMHVKLLERGYIGEHTIVAIGEQGAEPHNEGEGPVLPDSPIVFDVFPRSQGSRYYADCSRTVVKGKASPQVRAMFKAVKGAQGLGLSLLRAGVDGKKVHQMVADYLKGAGFHTFKDKRGLQGFTHGTGHGVGLDIHESPSLGKFGGPLPENSVVTVEPGLYYRGIGGMRIEDMALVTKGKAVNLTRAPKFLEL